MEPDSPDAIVRLTDLDAELLAHSYPPESRHAFSVGKVLRDSVAFFVSRLDGQPAGCGGVKLFDDYGEVKRMYVRPTFRDRRLGRAMLDRLTTQALEHHVDVLRLETGIYQTYAIALYERCGFRRRRPFGEYREDAMSVYMEKVI